MNIKEIKEISADDAWVILYVNRKEKCRSCGKKAKARCSGCFYAYYCSRKCQVKDYRSHKNSCRQELKIRILDYEFLTMDKGEYRSLFETIETKYNKTFNCDDLAGKVYSVPRYDYMAMRSLELLFWENFILSDEVLAKVKDPDEAIRLYGLRTIATFKKGDLLDTTRLQGVYEEEMRSFLEGYKSGKIQYHLLDFSIYQVKELIKVIMVEHIKGSSEVPLHEEITEKTNLFHSGHICLFFARIVARFYSEEPKLIFCYKIYPDDKYCEHVYVLLAGHIFDIVSEIDLEFAKTAKEVRYEKNYRLSDAKPSKGEEIREETKGILRIFVGLEKDFKGKSNTFIALAEFWDSIANDEEKVHKLKERHKDTETKLIQMIGYLMTKKEYPPECIDKIV